MGGTTPTLQTQEQIERLQALLQRKLGPEYLSTRTGGGGTKLTYLEGWRAISLANEVFGFNGWNTEIKELETDYCDQNPETGRFDVGVTARIRVYLKDGTSHEDIGYGKVENCKSKGDALDKCKKEAVTDGLKRALRIFGSLLGNCLYDKSYLEVVGKMKAPKVCVFTFLHQS
ncbi:Rad52/22 double-strand break repair protein [Atractiella rhizophila]|nr:Rad52/22 double-strand break repair protein [Atractiella rhizophila]